MGVRHWFRPPRHVLAIFVAVGIVSAAALAWLMGSLLIAEKAAERQLQQDRLEQAADRAVAAMQSAVSDLELQLGNFLEAIANLPEDVVVIRIGQERITTQHDQGLLYYPEPIRGAEASSTLFEATEQSERNEPS
jgi:hypothetical protein